MQALHAYGQPLFLSSLPALYKAQKTDASTSCRCIGRGGQRWIRTTEGVSQQIYSLPHLATLVFALLCVCDGKVRHKSRKHQAFPPLCSISRAKKLSSEAKTRGETARKRDVPLFLTVKCTDGSGIYSKDWMNCTILTAVMANSRPLFIFSPARSSACCSLLTVSTPLITGTLPVALSRTSPSVVPRQM